VRREARSAARTSRRLEVYRRLLLERLDGNPESERPERALLEALRDCQAKLPGPAARVLGLRYVECLGFEEIAAKVGGTGSAVQRMISRIRLQLRDCIKAKVATA
jgi:DNA-directed RNA polymerase specialized sigma24 family protein